ncbi:MAG: 16S rRNA (adenine(1518)-N(6)/adenine(1519)-N(6))-dimethyltransferase RsmA [Bacteroidota bacterium]
MNRPKKSLGQNFLIDQNVARKIVRSLNLRKSDCVLEIGPGKGALTALLLAELPSLTAVEIDDHLAAELQATYGDALTLYHNNVLNIDPHIIAKKNNGKLRIVGNIPYNITSPILFWVIDSSDVIKDCTLMMQQEVAKRLVAKPRTKEYGILSVFAQYYSTPDLKFVVAPGSFRPVPEVTSAVVSLNFDQPCLSRALDDLMFRAVVRGTFGKRRKTLRNGLLAIKVPSSFFQQSTLDFNRRPEELSVEEFVHLSNELSTGEQPPQILRPAR